MSASSNGGSDAGVNIALAGLAFQVITLVFFIATVVDYAFLSRHIWRPTKLSMKFKIFCGFLGGVHNLDLDTLLLCESA